MSPVDPFVEGLPDSPDGVSHPPEAHSPEAGSEPLRTTVVTGKGASVALAFVDISPLYRGYFATEEWVGDLGRDLGACFDGTVEVVISYDMETRIGRILVQTGLADLGCRPVMLRRGVDVTALAPLGRALARYRDAIAAARDVRIASFRSGIRLVQGGEVCDLMLGGQFPPDGTTFSGCMMLRGHEVCVGDRHDPFTVLPWPGGERTEVLSTCLGR